MKKIVISISFLFALSISFLGCAGDPANVLVSSSAVSSSSSNDNATLQSSAALTDVLTSETTSSSDTFSQPDFSGKSTTNITWKGIYEGQNFFKLFLVVNDEEYFAGQFYGVNMWTYSNPERTEPISQILLSSFSATWSGMGSDFQLIQKSDSELAVLYHGFPYNFNFSGFTLSDYEEILVIPIEKGSDVIVDKEVISIDAYVPINNPIFGKG